DSKEVVPFPPSPLLQPGPATSYAPPGGDFGCGQTVICQDCCWGRGLGWRRCCPSDCCCVSECCPSGCCPTICCPGICRPGPCCASECCVSDCGDCCGGWDCCNCCAPRPAFWASAEYLLWALRDQRVPALVTTSPPGTPVTTAGVLGQPTTIVLFGQDNLNND